MEENNVPVDTFMGIPRINESEDLTNKFSNLTINVGNKNNLIKKVANMTINDVIKNLVGCIANLTMKDPGNDLNLTNTSDV